MHWIDVGGRDIGSLSKFSTDIFQEGIQFRTVKLRSRGEPVPEMYRMIEHNTRFPVEMMGDINSQIGGCLMGRDSVVELVGRYGVATFRAALDTIWDQSEAEARAAIRAIPDGTYTRRGRARRRRPQSGSAALQGDGDRRRRRDDDRPVGAAAGSERADELRAQRRRRDGGAARIPLSAAAGGRRQRRHVPAAAR